jgi:hypothetical protein
MGPEPGFEFEPSITWAAGGIPGSDPKAKRETGERSLGKGQLGRPESVDILLDPPYLLPKPLSTSPGGGYPMKLLRIVSHGVLLPLVLLGLATQAEAAIATGTYNGTGSTVRFATGLTTVRAVNIWSLPIHGPVAQAYTSDALQQIAQGTFLNGSKKDNGITPDIGNVVVSSPDFTEQGVVYLWEARGD